MNVVAPSLGLLVSAVATRAGLIAVLLSLTACALFSSGGAGYPLRDRGLVPELPAQQEATAVVRVARGAVVEEYILALRASSSEVQAALLSPQGVPQYQIHFNERRREYSTQVYAGELLSAAILADYLQLIYLSEAKIGAALKKRWCIEDIFAQNTPQAVVEPAKRVRRLLQDCDTQKRSSAYLIRYSGSAPWFGEIEINDVFRAQTVTMTVLEAKKLDNKRLKAGNALSE